MICVVNKSTRISIEINTKISNLVNNTFGSSSPQGRKWNFKISLAKNASCGERNRIMTSSAKNIMLRRQKSFLVPLETNLVRSFFILKFRLSFRKLCLQHFKLLVLTFIWESTSTSQTTETPNSKVLAKHKRRCLKKFKIRQKYT